MATDDDDGDDGVDADECSNIDAYSSDNDDGLGALSWRNMGF